MFTQFNSTITWRGSTTALYRHTDYFVYTIHFHQGLAHGKQADTKHYTGLAGDIDGRLARHKSGNGSRLMSVVGERGIEWELAALVPCDTYQEAHELEKRLKRHSATRRCPVCAGKPKDVLVQLREGHWPISTYTRVGKRQPMKKNGSLYFD